MQQTMTREDVQELLDNGVIGSHKDGKKNIALKFATVKQLSPLRIKLDGDSASLPYSPIFAGTINIGLNDRVVCLMAGTVVVILGAVNKESQEASILKAYPVGSIYMSVNSTNPHDLFGGTWEQLQNRFLVGVGSSYSNGATGGASSYTPKGSVGGHKLTINEIPSHTHKTDMWFNNGSTGSPARYGITYSDAYGNNGGDWGELSVASVGGNGSHNHGFTGTAQTILPPYLAVYMWKRTA